MPNAIPINDVDIYKYPTNIVKPNVALLAIGDLHANAMFLLHFLVSHGFVEITTEAYEHLAAIYRQEETTADDIKVFSHIINAMTINQDVPDILFVGDETCDRGQNDLWILLILQKLKKSDVNYKILLSNHGVEFVLPFEKKGKLIPDKAINFDNQTLSMNNLNQLLEKKLFMREDVNRLVGENYLPNLQLISYSLVQGDITIFSHAAIGLDTIQALAKQFSVPCNFKNLKTAQELADIIDAINLKFSNYVQRKEVYKLINKERKVDSALMFTIWNRTYNQLKRPETWKGFKLNFVHGHDQREHTIENIYNLDNQDFKGVDKHVGSYQVLAGKPRVKQEKRFADALRDVQKPELSYIDKSELQKFKPDVQQLIREKGGTSDIFKRLINAWLGNEYQYLRQYFISQLSLISAEELENCFEFIRKYGDNISEIKGAERVDSLIKTFPIYIEIPDVEYSQQAKRDHLKYRMVRVGHSPEKCEKIASALIELDDEVTIRKKITNYSRLLDMIPNDSINKIDSLSSEDWKVILLDQDASEYMNFKNLAPVSNHASIQLVLDYGLRHTLLKKLDKALKKYEQPKYLLAKLRHNGQGIRNAQKFCTDIKKSNLPGAEILQTIKDFIDTGPQHTYSFRTILKDAFFQKNNYTPVP